MPPIIVDDVRYGLRPDKHRRETRDVRARGL